MTDLTDRDVRRLWLEAIRQAHVDAHSQNGHRQEACQWLSAASGARRVLIHMGWTPQRARAACDAALKHPPRPGDEL